MTQIGITERGDAALDTTWISWICSGKPAILITKDPLKLLHIVNSKVPQKWHKNIILHATITGMAGTRFEPNVLPLKEKDRPTLRKYLKQTELAKKVLRVDPIIPTKEGVETAVAVVDQWQNCFDELRISFIDNYPHLKTRGFILPWEGLHAPLEIRKAALEVIEQTSELPVSVCGEPGILCSGCVSQSDIDALGIEEMAKISGVQRPACACAGQKFELLSNKHPCQHQCIYCYWKN